MAARPDDIGTGVMIGSQAVDDDAIGLVSKERQDLTPSGGGCSDSASNRNSPGKSPESGFHLIQQDVRLKGLPRS